MFHQVYPGSPQFPDRPVLPYGDESIGKSAARFLETIPIVACAPAEENTIVDYKSYYKIKSAVERRKLFEEIDQNLMNYYNPPAKHQTYIRRKCQTVELL